MAQTDGLLKIVHNKERRMLRAMIKIYGDDASVILNGLHEMAARIAIASGVTPENFAGGMKAHWDFIVNSINEHTDKLRAN